VHEHTSNSKTALAGIGAKDLTDLNKHVPDPDFLGECIERSYQEMLTSCRAPARRKRAKRTKPIANLE
jgi:hypothetical protein